MDRFRFTFDFMFAFIICSYLFCLNMCLSTESAKLTDNVCSFPIVFMFIVYSVLYHCFVYVFDLVSYVSRLEAQAGSPSFMYFLDNDCMFSFLVH